MCAAGKRPPAHSPTVTAGLKCPPEIGPSAYAPVSTVNPNASDTPANPIPSCGNAAARTALPHPPSTSQNVPRNSAVSFENMKSSQFVDHIQPGAILASFHAFAIVCCRINGTAQSEFV